MNKQQQPPKAQPSKGNKPKQAKPKSQNGNKPGRYQQGLKSAPVAKARVRQVAEPRFTRSSGNGDITVEHEEFIQDISGSVAFSNTSIPVQPGLSSSFPWVSAMAPLYESYLFEKLEYRFESTSATTATGTVMMAVDYDASDAAAATKAQLATYRRFVRSAPWEECSNVSLLEDLRKQKTYFVRSGTLSANQDIKLYDVGNLNIAVQGQADTALIGELYVKYRIRFITPQLLLDGVGLSQSANFNATSLAGAFTKVGNAPLTASGTGAALTLTSTAPYQGLVSFVIVGTTITDIVGSGTATETATGEVINAGGTQGIAPFICNWTAAGQTLVITSTAATASVVSCRVGQYNVVANA